MKPKVLIVARGGVVQEVDASVDMDIYIVDHDNFDHEATVATLEVARTPEKPHCICDVEEAVKGELAEYVCTECDALLSDSAGEGYDGMCGNCADKKDGAK